MKISIQSFRGVAPKLNPRYLADGMAQTALDVEAFGTSLKPLANLGGTITTLTKSGTLQSIYRFGQDLTTDTQHWFSWDSDVDVCRGQVSGDVWEWTYYSGNGPPRATHAGIALAGGSTALPAVTRPLGLPAPTGRPWCTVFNQPLAGTAPSVFIPTAMLSSIIPNQGLHVSSDGFVNDSRSTGRMAGNSAVAVAAAINALPGVSAVSSSSGVTVTSDTGGANVALAVGWSGAGWTQTGTLQYTLSAQGADVDPGLPEARVYVYTWISEEAGLIMESPPSPPSAVVNAYDNTTVFVNNLGLSAYPEHSGLNITGKRLYRSVNGVFLLVKDNLTPGLLQFKDDVPADQLGEPLTSADWVMPPSTLRGLTNLPNGILAGFSGRDVYFSAPYRPYAWSSSSTYAVDAPIVGLGRMDTTLAVLTKGLPFFIQGSSPDAMTVVEADLRQACVSKRSIVSMGGAVFYASPDGLVMLSPGGSKILTEELFEREQWQATFNPASIHAYGHDSQYVAFYSKGATQGGFVYDTRSGQLVIHGMYAQGGYADLRNDTLFLLLADKRIVAWKAGAKRTGTYRSKRFSLPQITGFSCLQVEAEGYPLTCRVYRDGSLLHTQTVTSREPFRLPPRQGRDWEIELVTAYEVFNVVIAQSMSEIASG